MASPAYPRLPRYHSFAMRVITSMPRPFRVYALRLFNLSLRRKQKYLVTTRGGFEILCSPRELIQLCIMQFGHWEPNVSAVIQTLVRPGACVADIGANIGYDTLLMSRCAGPEGIVVCFEAFHKTFTALQENLSLNHVANVRPNCLAISDSAGTITIYPGDPRNSGSASIHGAGGGLEGSPVAALPLRDALNPDEAANLEFIKMDVEGAEVPIMANILRDIHSFPLLRHILVEVSSAENSEWATIWKDMQGLGFVAYSIENDYSYDFYLTWKRPSPPRQIDVLPEKQTDILFTRESVAALAVPGNVFPGSSETRR